MIDWALRLGGVDYTNLVNDDLVIQCSAPNQSGLILVNADVSLSERITGLNIGAVAEIYYGLGLPLRHTLRVATVPTWDVDSKAFLVTLECELSYYNHREPQSEVSEIDPNVGVDRKTLVRELLLKAGCANVGDLDGIPDKIYYPESKYGTDGYVQFAGQLAFATGIMLYVDAVGQINEYFQDYIEPTPVYIPQRHIRRSVAIDNDAYRKPYKKYKCMGSKLSVTNLDYGDEGRVISEEYRPVSEVFGGANDTPILFGDVREVKKYDGNTIFTTIATRSTTVKLIASASQNSITPQGGIRVSGVEEIIETYDDKTGYLLTRIRNKQKLEIGAITTQGNTTTVSDGLVNYERVIEEYFYNSDEYLIKSIIYTDNPVGELYSGLVPPVGDFPTPERFKRNMGTSYTPNTEVTTTWVQESDDVWLQTTRSKKAAALGLTIAGQAYSRYQMDDVGTTTEYVSSPPQPDEMPLKYSLKETQIEAEAEAQASPYYATTFTQDVPYVRDEADLKRSATWFQNRDWRVAKGRNVTLSLDDSYSLNFLPYRTIYHHTPQGEYGSYHLQDWTLTLGADECVIEFDAPQIYSYQPSAPATNTPTIFLTPPPNLDGGVIYYVDADGSVRATPGGTVLEIVDLDGLVILNPTTATPPVKPIISLSGVWGWSCSAAKDVIGEFGSNWGWSSSIDNLSSLWGWSVSAAVSGARITSFSPQIGTVGVEITINGVGLGTASAVSIGGAPVSGFVIVGDTQIKATVGAGAASGVVVVATTGGLISIDGFQFFSTSAGFAFVWTAPIKTANFTALANEGYYTNNSITVTYPAGSVGTRFGVASLDLSPIFFPDGRSFNPESKFATYFNLSPDGWIPEQCCNSYNWAANFGEMPLVTNNTHTVESKNDIIAELTSVVTDATSAQAIVARSTAVARTATAVVLL